MNFVNCRHSCLTELARAIKAIILLIAAILVLLSVNTFAQSSGSAQADAAFRLKAIRLEGFEAKDHKGISQDEIENQIELERERFGKYVTTEQLHIIADALTLFFRRQGYAFHSVYLPPQKVQAGLVILNLKPGVLGDVHVINNSSNKGSTLVAPFKRFQQKILYAPQIEQTVEALKMQQVASVFAFYSRGAEPGEARLNLRVEDMPHIDLRASLDNYGGETSGKQRLIAGYSQRHITGHYDTLSLSVLRVVDDIDNTYGNIHYTLPVAGLRFELFGSYSNNQYEVGDRLAALGLQGNTTVASFGARRYFKFKSRSRSNLQLTYAQKESQLESDVGAVSHEISQAWSLEVQKRWQSDDGGWLLQSNAGLMVGRFDNLAETPQQNFYKLSLAQIAVLGWNQGRWRNLVQLSGRTQQSQNPLPLAETMGLTGVYGVRGFTPNLFNAETGVIGSFEWRLPNFVSNKTGNWRLEPFLHGDFAVGEQGTGLATSKAHFISAGFGMRFNLGKHLSAQVLYAQGQEGLVDAIEVQSDDQVWFEIRLD